MSNQHRNHPRPNWPCSAIILYCRAGFESECAEEAIQMAHAEEGEIKAEWKAGGGMVRLVPKRIPHMGLLGLKISGLIFSRQILFEVAMLTDLPEKDRLTPVLDAMSKLPSRVGELWLETADTNEAKSLSGFCRRFGEKLADAAFEAGYLTDDPDGHRLVLFWPDMKTVHFALAKHGNRNEWPNAIPRLRMPFEAPSRSTLKLAEAIHVFMTDQEANQRFKEGMRGVDIGAAPGGWTWQLVTRGLKVFAIDNGPLKGSVQGHPQVKHLRQDGFKFRPDKPVDWLVCDMVEQPVRVANLMATWFVEGLTREAIFNLKLPMKKRLAEVARCFNVIHEALDGAGIKHSLQAKQLYHDREEITVYVRKMTVDRPPRQRTNKR